MRWRDSSFPLRNNLSFTGEWFSGNHLLSALIPGFTYHREDLIVVAGYKFSNDFDPHKSGVVLEIGYFFGGPSPDKFAPPEHYGIFR